MLGRLLRVVLTAQALAASHTHYDYYLTGSPADVRRSTAPGLMLSGGAGDVPEAFRWFLRKSGGGDVVVLRATGSDAYNGYLQSIAPVDSVESFVIRSAAATRDPRVLRAVRNAEALFIAGGDQWNYVRLWKNSPLEDEINKAFLAGKPVGGSSAGLAILGEFSFSAQHDTVTSKEALADPFSPKVTIESDFLNFPLLRGAITDSHFSARDRMGRLLVFLARLRVSGRKDVVGIGIDEATALLLDPDGSSRIVGKGAAYFVSPTVDPEVCLPGRPLTIGSIQVSKVPAGGSFDFRNLRARDGSSYYLIVNNGEIRSAAQSREVY